MLNNFHVNILFGRRQCGATKALWSLWTGMSDVLQDPKDIQHQDCQLTKPRLKRQHAQASTINTVKRHHTSYRQTNPYTSPEQAGPDDYEPRRSHLCATILK